MELANLRQPCNHSTLLGVMRGAADYYGRAISTPMLYGLSGHAFVMNIHRQLCPSGPYCWQREPFYRLLRNAGLEVEDYGFFWDDGGESTRAEVEAKLKAALAEGVPCFLVNMEYQLITGYDATGFLTAQPWAPNVDFPQKHVTFGDWQEFGKEVHVNFHALRAIVPAERQLAVLDALAYAGDLWANPTSHTSGDYGMGPDAYRNWIAAVQDGHGASHGNWWNGTVYAECRQNAAAWFGEIAELWPVVAGLANSLAERYGRIASAVKQASDKELADEPKLAALAEAGMLEAECVADLPALAEAISAAT